MGASPITTVKGAKGTVDGVVHGGELLFPWSSIQRVAIGWEHEPLAMHDALFWAFDQSFVEPSSMWVSVFSFSGRFSTAVQDRFQIRGLPAIEDWVDPSFRYSTRVVWPMGCEGQSLYETVEGELVLRPYSSS